MYNCTIVLTLVPALVLNIMHSMVHMLVYSPVLALLLSPVHSPVRIAAYRAHGQKPATPLKLVATILGVRASQSDDVLPSSRWSVRDPHHHCSFRVRADHILSFLQQHLHLPLSVLWKISLHIVYFTESTMSYCPSCLDHILPFPTPTPTPPSLPSFLA